MSADKKTVKIYTDGACSGNPGPGGWGSLLIYHENIKELSGAEGHTTNNRMEIMAAIKALEALKVPCVVELYTDSAYLCNAFNKSWLPKWQKNGWLNSSKKPVENIDLWKQLLEMTSKHEVTFFKVKGHADNKNNNRCDELARNAIKSLGNV